MIPTASGGSGCFLFFPFGSAFFAAEADADDGAAAAVDPDVTAAFDTDADVTAAVDADSDATAAGDVTACLLYTSPSPRD